MGLCLRHILTVWTPSETFGRLLSVEKDLKRYQSRIDGLGFYQNTVWDTGLTAPRETGFAQIWHG